MPDQNDLGSRYMKESGLYRLIAKSKMHFAEAFQDWVEEEVLPGIRKTGSYSVQTAVPEKQNDGWLDKRLEGKELMKVKNASLQQLIAGGFGQTGPKLCYSSQSHQPGSPRLHRDNNQLQEAAATAKACQHPRHTEHAGPGGQVLCRDMLSEVCR